MKNTILIALVVSISCIHSIETPRAVNLNVIDPFTREPLRNNIAHSLACDVDDKGNLTPRLAFRCFIALLTTENFTCWCHAETAFAYFNRHSGNTVKRIEVFQCTPETSSAVPVKTQGNARNIQPIKGLYWNNRLYEKYLAPHGNEHLEGIVRSRDT